MQLESLHSACWSFKPLHWSLKLLKWMNPRSFADEALPQDSCLQFQPLSPSPDALPTNLSNITAGFSGLHFFQEAFLSFYRIELIHSLLVTDIPSGCWTYFKLLTLSGWEHPPWTKIWKRTCKVHFARLKGVFQTIGRDYAPTALHRTRHSYARIMFQFSAWANGGVLLVAI